MEEFEVHISDDFDLAKIIASGQCFRPERLPDGWCRFITGRQVLYIRQSGQGAYAVRCGAGEWESVWQRYFDMGRSYSALRARLAAQSPDNAFVQRALISGAGIRILRQDVWEMLISYIISQRKSIPAIRTAVNTLAERYGDAVDGAGEAVHLFPTVEQLAAVPEEELAACGLGYRTRYVANAARAAASGELDMSALASLDDEALFARLMQLDGVGKKVANCVCLYGYGRTAMAPIDVWVQRLIDEEFGGENPFPQYGQEAGIMQQYLFCYKRDSAKGKK